MNSSRPTHAHTTPDTPATLAVRAAENGLTRAAVTIGAVGDQRPTDPVEHAARALRLQELHARQARWWAVLQRATDYRTVPFVYLDAVIRAKHAAEDSARFWRDTAADWTARALHRPTSDVAGAMSNWDELGVTDLGRPHLAEAVPAIGAGR